MYRGYQNSAVRKFSPAIYVKLKRLISRAERNTLLGLLINHVIIPGPRL